VAQLSTLGHIVLLDFDGAGFVAESALVRRLEMRQISAVSLVLARADFTPRADFELWIYERFDSPILVWERHVDVA